MLPLFAPPDVGRAGDIQMRPLQALRELAEERRGRDGAAFATADVGEVREVALELVRILLGERQVPAAVIRALAGVDELARERIVIRHAARVVRAERHDARAGERGDVHDRRGLVAARVVERFAQHEAAFRVRVEDLDGLARRRW